MQTLTLRRHNVQAPEDDVHARDEWNRRVADRVDQLGLRLEQIALRVDQLVRIVEVLQHVVLRLRLERVQAVGDRPLEGTLAVRQVDGQPLRLADDADQPAVSLDVFLADRRTSAAAPVYGLLLNGFLGVS